MILFLGNLETTEDSLCEEGKFLCQVEPDTYICVTKQDIENNKKKHAYLAASHVCYLKWAHRLR